MCRVKTIEVTSLPFRFYRDECRCLPSPVDYVEFQIGDGNTFCVTVERARRNPAQWPAIADAYGQWRRPVLRLTYQPRVRVKAIGISFEPLDVHAGRL